MLQSCTFWFISNSSSYSVSIPSILSSFGQNQIWRCSFLKVRTDIRCPNETDMRGTIFGDSVWTPEEAQAPSATGLKHFEKPGLTVNVSVSIPKGQHQKAQCANLHLEVLSSQTQSRSIPGARHGRRLPWFVVKHRDSGPSAFPSCMSNTSPLTPFILLLIFKIGKKGYLLQKPWENCLQRIQAATSPTSSCISSSFLHCFPRRHLRACSILSLMPLQF